MLGIGEKFPGYALTGVVSNDPKKAFRQFSSEEQAGQWQIVFFWPKDFTFVCPTEIVEFDKKLKAKDHFLTRVLDKPKLFVIGNQDELGKITGPVRHG